MSPGSPPEDNLTEIDPETEASLADFSIQSADATSIWIQAFAAAPRPFSSDLLHISGQAIHDMLAEAFEVDAESFWISWNSKPIPRADTSLAAIGVLPAGPRPRHGRKFGTAVLGLLPPTPSSTFLPHLPSPSPVLCWNCTSLGTFTQTARRQELDLLLTSERAGICLLQEICCPSIHIHRFETLPYPFGPGLAGTTVLCRKGIPWRPPPSVLDSSLRHSRDRSSCNPS